MKVEQIYTGCLAEAAYYIESKGEVAIIDPLRESAPYIERAEADQAKIKYIFETHFHADFVSGHIDLARKTGGEIVFGPNANPSYEVIVATDGQEFKIGDVTIKVLHTPGHTMESTTYLLVDEEGKNQAIFSGDTLFIGDVGRPDLAVKSDLTKEDLAGYLYDSLRNKILPLEDHLTVYPGHGAGSACGKNMSSETTDTLGNQKQTNYALQPMSRAKFIKEVTDGLMPPPQYFPKNVALNKEGYGQFDEVLKKGNSALTVDEFEELANQGALMLDVRAEEAFIESHIPNSIFIGLSGSFASWVGTLIEDLKQPIILVVEEGKEEEAITRLSRVGYDNTLGYLKGGIQSWQSANKEVESVKSISSQEFEGQFSASTSVVDVRKETEFQAEHIEKARNFPLGTLNANMNEFKTDNELFLHCKGGYRSVIAISILKSRGFHNVLNIEGGFDEIVKTKVPTTEFICPSTL